MAATTRGVSGRPLCAIVSFRIVCVLVVLVVAIATASLPNEKTLDVQLLRESPGMLEFGGSDALPDSMSILNEMFEKLFRKSPEWKVDRHPGNE